MVEDEKPPSKRRKKTPIGDRRQFLTMMSPEVIKAVQQAALDDERAAWAIMEEAAKEWLERRDSRRSESKS